MTRAKRANDYLVPAYCLLLTAYCLLLTAYCLLLTAYCLLLTAYCLLLTACKMPEPANGAFVWPYLLPCSLCLGHIFNYILSLLNCVIDSFAAGWFESRNLWIICELVGHGTKIR